MKKAIVKINETKTWFFEKINKIGKSLGILIKKKRERAQINKIRKEKGEGSSDNTEIQRIIRDCYKELYEQKNGQCRRNEQILRKVQLSKTEPGRNR